jgi:peptide/nickel transport system substrate-binding protein
VALCVGLLTGCPGATETASAPNPRADRAVDSRVGGQLFYGLEIDPTGLDPTRNAWDYAGIQVANALYDPLAAYDADGRPRPYLLESFTPGAGFTSWALKLRPDIRFHNGEPLNADALLEFIAAMRSSFVIGSATQLLTGARKVDDLTVQVSTSRPWASLPVLLAGQGGYVVSPSHVAVVDGHTHPIGTGPFVLRKWQTGKRMELVRNPRYWQPGQPYLDAVDFVVVPEGGVRLEMLEAGDLDATAVTSPPDIDALDRILSRDDRPPRITDAVDHSDAEKTTIVFNTTKAPFDDVRVRQAIGYATDMQAIAHQNRWPVDRIAQGPFNPASPYFSPAAYPIHDVDKARALVDEYLTDVRVLDRPAEITFTLVAPDIWRDLVNQLVAQWADAGIRATTAFTDVKSDMQLAVYGGFDAEVLSFFAAPDPDVLWHFLVSDTVSNTGTSLNLARLRDPDITAGMNEGRARPDDGARKAAYTRVQDAMARQLPYLWLQRERWRIATSLRVRDARNVTLPDRSAALPFLTGTHRLNETRFDR